MPEFSGIRVYIDSNVLFSASYREDSALLALWNLENVVPLVSQYAVDEVSRNMGSSDHRQRFETLLARTQFVSDADTAYLPSHVSLAAKDRPILAAAVFAGVDFLVTGDFNHFGHLYGAAVSHVKVFSPIEFLRLHNNRLRP